MHAFPALHTDAQDEAGPGQGGFRYMVAQYLAQSPFLLLQILTALCTGCQDMGHPCGEHDR